MSHVRMENRNGLVVDVDTLNFIAVARWQVPRRA